jgi:hypothetical protein
MRRRNSVGSAGADERAVRTLSADSIASSAGGLIAFAEPLDSRDGV